MDFSGKVGIVTGGANGIGAAVARGFVARGGKVVIVDRDAAAGEALAASLGASALFRTADVTKSPDVAAYVKAALDRFGAIDCFHNNAGIEGRVARLAEYEEAVFDQIMAVNVKGVFLGLRHVLPVVNTASIAGLVGSPGMAAYSASKHAVNGLTKSVAGEVGPNGIRVNAVCPGPIATRMIEEVSRQVSPNNPKGVEERYAAGIPLRRYGTAEEVANLVLFLLSDLASNMTGGEYTVDGGRTAAPAGVSGGTTQ
jgi:NAD(P)-dependent dehydrogenase (short-subunit alcohol dehydrogenase family)